MQCKKLLKKVRLSGVLNFQAFHEYVKMNKDQGICVAHEGVAVCWDWHSRAWSAVQPAGTQTALY